MYMGPVNLNKDTFINKAGIEVDVIPIMRTPSPSPKPKRKSKRARSEMGFHRKQKALVDDSTSLPDLQRSKAIPIRGSLIETIIRLKPERFLSRSLETDSTDSLVSSILESEGRIAHSLGSTESLSKGAITNAVVNWLHKSSPFGSTDTLERHSCCASIADTGDTNISVFDDEESMDSSGLFSESGLFDSGSLKTDTPIPAIYVSNNDGMPYFSDYNLQQKSGGSEKTKHSFRRQPCTLEQTPLGK